MTESTQYSSLIMAPLFKVGDSSLRDPSRGRDGRLLASQKKVHTREGKVK
jgi:hypothetical protein